MTGQVTLPTRETFMREWQALYPSALPIKEHLNNVRFPNRWMRIHSLPLSKRYPDSKAEWDILLHRQNTVIDKLVPQGTVIQFVFNWIEKDNYLFKSFDLEPLGIIQTAKDEPAYESFLLETIWESGTENPILMMIADETLRGFIVAPDCLIGPYGGGMDVILKDPHTCYTLRRHFKDWLSLRADGL
jgi:hypothetical protein